MLINSSLTGCSILHLQHSHFYEFFWTSCVYDWHRVKQKFKSENPLDKRIMLWFARVSCNTAGNESNRADKRRQAKVHDKTKSMEWRSWRSVQISACWLSWWKGILFCEENTGMLPWCRLSAIILSVSHHWDWKIYAEWTHHGIHHVYS